MKGENDTAKTLCTVYSVHLQANILVNHIEASKTNKMLLGKNCDCDV